LQNDREWKAFCEQVLERPDMALDPRFVGNSRRSDHRDVIAGVIGDVLPKLTTTEALSRLNRAGIGTAEVRDMAGLWAHPQLAARGRWQQIDTPAGAMPALTPTSGQGWKPQMAPVPRLGEHTQQILEEFGPGSVSDATADPKNGA
jgi:itaconate CoA-transferase